MKRRIVYVQEDGKLAVIYPADLSNITKALEVVPPNTQHWVVDSKALPKHDRLFFNAWEMDLTRPNYPKVVINLERAKKITRKVLAKKIQPKIDELNARILDAMIERKEPNEIDTIERRVLKESLHWVDLAKSVEELKDLLA